MIGLSPCLKVDLGCDVGWDQYLALRAQQPN
jgi:hypothetical protein